MANPYFGNVGDVWKHLALSEILAVEQPRRYLESHAGSAAYPIEAREPKPLDFREFAAAAERSPALAAAAYTAWLREELAKGRYPGSPLLALLLLGASRTTFTFADLDGESLATIAVAARELDIRETRLELVQGDGLDAIAARADRPQTDDVLAFIDPFDAFSPSARGATSVDVLRILAARGVKAVLWFPIFRVAQLDDLHSALNDVAWTADLTLTDRAPIDGLIGCGIAAANLAPETTERCGELGRALEDAFPALAFEPTRANPAR